MEKTLFIHIGGPKTGTTAIQEFLSMNRQALEGRGLFYPDCDKNHRRICTELREHSVTGIGSLSGAAVMRWLGEVERSPLLTCVISAECMSSEVDPKILRELIPAQIRVKIIYYARRQDELMESWYKEMVRASWERLPENLDDTLVEAFYQRVQFDHLATIAPWAEAFGRENILVRGYEKNQMPSGSIEDFCGIVGITLIGALKMPAGLVNRSMNIHHVEFMRLCNRYFKDQPGINRYLYFQQFQESRGMEHLPVQHRLSPATRIAILKHFEASNGEVAREYLGREDGRLFYAPGPDPSEPWEPYRGLTAEELVPILTEMLYTSEKRWWLETGRRNQDREPLKSCLEILNYFLKKGLLIVPRSVKQYILAKKDGWYNRK